MHSRIVAAFAVLALGTAVSAPALAYDGAFLRQPLSSTAYDGTSAHRAGRGVHDGADYERCARSSASEGNANQQTRPVKQYGQTAGGYRC